MCLSPKEAIEAYITGVANKATQSYKHILIKSLLAGMMIGMGAAGSSVAAHSVESVGLARFIAALVFPVGLMMVILLGAELFTGDCLMIVGVQRGTISVKKFISFLAVVFVGNFIGALLLAICVFLSGQFDYSNGLLGAYTIKVALAKANITPVKAITSGILCNILVSAAVLMAICSKDVTGKLLVCFFVIMLFVTSGFEHCVANMYYISAGILAKLNPTYVEVAINQYHLNEAVLAQLDIWHMLFVNLLPVTIGNVIGGSFVVGLTLYYLNNSEAHSKENIKQMYPQSNATKQAI